MGILNTLLRAVTWWNGQTLNTQIFTWRNGWLHRTWKQPPTDKPLVHKVWEKPHQENLTGTDLAYAPAGSIRRMNPVERKDYEAWSPE